MKHNHLTALVLVLVMSLTLYGCSSGGGCNQSYGQGTTLGRPATEPTLPNPDPTPTPTVTPTPPAPGVQRVLQLSITYPDGNIIPGVTVTSSNPGVLLPPVIDENGNLVYSVNPAAADGMSFRLSFQKDGHIFDDLDVILDGNRLVLADGTLLYEKAVTGYVPLIADDSKYLVSTWRITGARFCTYCNGIAAIPGTSEKSGGSLLANGFYLASTNGNIQPCIGKMDTNGDFTLFAGRPDVNGDGTIADDGIGTAAKFAYPYALAVSSNGKTLYATDSAIGGGRIRKIDTATKQVTTIVNIPGIDLSYAGLKLTADDNFLYLGAGSEVLKIDLSDNSYTTVGSGFYLIVDIALAPTEDVLYVMDYYGMEIYTLNLSTNSSSLLAGSLTGPIGSFGSSSAIAVSPDGQTIYATDGHAISAVDPLTGAITVFAGDVNTHGNIDGIGTAARMDSPQGISITPDGKAMFVLSDGDHYIYNINIETGYVTTLLGGKTGYHGFQEGYASTISSSYMSDLAFSPDGKKVYIVNSSSPSDILCFNFESGLMETFAGDDTGLTGTADGLGQNARFGYPWGICVTRTGNYLYVTDRSNKNIRRIDTVTKEVTTVTTAALSSPYDIDVSPNGQFLYVADSTVLKKIDLNDSGAVTPIGSFTSLTGVAVNNDGSKVYVTSSVGVSVVDTATNQVTLLSDGSSSGAAFDSLVGYVTISADGQYLFVTNGQRIVSVKIADGTAKTIAGQPSSFGSANGYGEQALFNTPYGIAVNPAGNAIYVADYSNSVLRRIIAVTE